MRSRMDTYYKALWAAALVFLLFLAGSLAYVYSVYRSNDELSTGYLRDAAEQRSAAVAQQMEGDLQLLRSLAISIAETGIYTRHKTMDLLNDINMTNDFSQMGIAYRNGRADFVNLKGEWTQGLNLVGEPVFEEAMQGRATISSTFNDPYSGEDIQYYGMPIYHEDGSVEAVLLAASPAGRLWDLIEVPVLQGEGSFIILDEAGVATASAPGTRSGVVIGESLYSRIDFRGSGEAARMQSALATGKEAEFVFDIDGEEQLALLLPLDVNGWSLLSVVPHSALTTYYNKTAKGTAVIIVMAGLIFLFLLYRQVHLTTRTQRGLEQLAYTDPLTGARNYTKFLLDAEAILRENEGAQFAVWSYDIKKFNNINEVFGSEIGDSVIKRAAGLLDGGGPKAAFCHVSADQFAGIRPYTDKQELEDWFEQLHAESTSDHSIISQSRMRVNIALGVYCTGDFNERLPVDHMVNCAAIAKKQAKETAGSRMLFFSQSMSEALRWDAQLEAGSAAALQNREMQFYLQPKVALEDGVFRIAGAEALARWRHPVHGLVPPASFIPLFENNGFVVELDRYIYENVCAWYSRQRVRGLPPLTLSVNVSRQGLLRDDLVSHYAAVKEHYGIEDGVLELEFTEGVIFDNYNLFQQTVIELQNRGFLCSIDDFGSGYSSLNVLKHLPIDVLKLDAEFFRDGLATRRERVVIADFISLARQLDIHTVAEGVETPDQVAFLQASGCDLVQGYVFSEPLPADEFIDCLERTKGRISF